MYKKIGVVLFVCLLMLTTILFLKNSQVGSQKKEHITVQYKNFDAVIYGGGAQGAASAIKASEITKDKKRIVMIVPEKRLGSILTEGAQNLYDVRQYKSQNIPTGLPKNYPWAQGGSMELFYKEPTIVFSPDKLSEALLKQVEKHPNITVLYEHDIEKVVSDKKKKKITLVKVYPLKKDKKNRYIYDVEKPIKIKAPVFIDASETGKLTYISELFNGTIGREDINKDKKQMVATLMFKLKGLNMEYVQKHEKEGAPFKFYFTNKGSLGILGGYEINDDPEFQEYSEQNKSFRFKPYNGGEDGYSGKNKQNENTEMWMNMFLVYDVDARKMWRDKVMNNGNYPEDGGLDPEIAREQAIQEIKSDEFISVVRRLPGLEKAELVMDKKDEPVVGEIMYLRESIHSFNSNKTFALTQSDTYGLKDERHYEHRIGLGFYNFDSNTYVKGEKLSEPRTTKPWYVPYEVLTSTATNLLIPGYAANIDSYTWRAMRVYPNLIVLGDAAGVAAGLYLENKFNIHKPTKGQIELLQTKLKEMNAILEK